MEVDHNISKVLLQVIDDLWVYAAPLLLAYILKDYIANIVAYCRIRWSKMDYMSVGQTKVLINGKWQRMFKLKVNKVAFEYWEKEPTKKRIITTMSTREYWKMNHTFEGMVSDD